MIKIIFILASLIFLIAYISYGRYLGRKYKLDDGNNTPSHIMFDGVDYVPTNKIVLLGHHFSSIAGAGPIVGPILAGIAFGWLPALLWIVLGCIFIGGVHDFSALTASIRHNARSIADIAKEYLTERARKLFLLFVWLALVYIIIVFIDLTAETFVKDGGIATSSLLYVILAFLFGLSIYRWKLSLVKASAIFVPLIFLGIIIGQELPVEITTFGLMDPQKAWSIILLIYCIVASILPVWILLQPRDYLSSYLLYVSVLVGSAGLLLGDIKISYPSFVTFHSPALGYLFPILFITVACGAISGFHSLVASGTTSKQLNKEKDALLIGYGGMLIEGLVAVIALSAVIMISKDSDIAKGQPLLIFSNAMGKFFSSIHLKEEYGSKFGLLALSAFILTTLDTATRIGRYVLQELFKISGARARLAATMATVFIPFLLLFVEFKDAKGNILPAWKIIWPLFGSTNQLLGALALLIIYVWLKTKKIPSFFLLIPMIFMLAITLSSLMMLILKYKFQLIGIIAILLFILAIFLVLETIKVLKVVLKK